MESTEGQLSTRLTDGLRCDNADNLSLLNHPGGSEITSVALCADTLAGLAGKHGTYLDLLYRKALYQGGGILADFLAGRDDELSCERVEYVVYGSTSENPFSERLHNLVLALDCRSDEAPESTAILLVDDDVV